MKAGLGGLPHANDQGERGEPEKLLLCSNEKDSLEMAHLQNRTRQHFQISGQKAPLHITLWVSWLSAWPRPVQLV